MVYPDRGLSLLQDCVGTRRAVSLLFYRYVGAVQTIKRQPLLIIFQMDKLSVFEPGIRPGNKLDDIFED